jgi:hypothetical protein
MPWKLMSAKTDSIENIFERKQRFIITKDVFEYHILGAQPPPSAHFIQATSVSIGRREFLGDTYLSAPLNPGTCEHSFSCCK